MGHKKIHAGTLLFQFSIQFEVMVSSAHANASLNFACLTCPYLQALAQLDKHQASCDILIKVHLKTKISRAQRGSFFPVPRPREMRDPNPQPPGIPRDSPGKMISGNFGEIK